MVIGIGFVFPALCEGVFGFRVSGLFWCGSGWSFPVQGLGLRGLGFIREGRGLPHNRGCSDLGREE